jgi:hypothetical protein
MEHWERLTLEDISLKAHPPALLLIMLGEVQTYMSILSV